MKTAVFCIDNKAEVEVPYAKEEEAFQENQNQILGNVHAFHGLLKSISDDGRESTNIKLKTEERDSKFEYNYWVFHNGMRIPIFATPNALDYVCQIFKKEGKEFKFEACKSDVIPLYDITPILQDRAVQAAKEAEEQRETEEENSRRIEEFSNEINSPED